MQPRQTGVDRLNMTEDGPLLCTVEVRFSGEKLVILEG